MDGTDKKYKTGITNDPFSHPTVTAGCDFGFILKSTDGQTRRTDGRTTCVNIVITTGRDCELAEWINNSTNAESKGHKTCVISDLLSQTNN